MTLTKPAQEHYEYALKRHKELVRSHQQSIDRHNEMIKHYKELLHGNN